MSNVPSYLQPPPSRPNYYYEPGLGLSAGGSSLLSSVSSVSAAAGPIGAAVSVVTGALHALFGGSDPKPAERKANADQLYGLALAGDTVAEAQLRCLSGIGNAADQALMESHPVYDTPGEGATGYGGGCLGGGWATSVARGYGRAKLLELDARRLAGQVGGALIKESNIPSTVVGTIQRAAANPMVWAGLAVAGFLILRKRR